MTDVVHVVVPASMDDPRRPSGGNVYDRRLCDELSARRWRVCTHFDGPGLASCVDLIPDDAVVLVDAIVATAATDVFLAHARRLRLVVLSHMPFATADEAHVLAAARAVVTTSAWSRDELLRRYPIAADDVYVASPGADAGAFAEFSSRGGNLLCVGAVAPHKGHDVLIEALGRVADLRWHCVLVGALDLDPAFVVRLRRQAASDGIAARLSFAGPLDREALETTYRTTDLLLSASHSESYGMVVTEALAHGIPVLATDVGGVAEALGQDRGGRPPGRLVPPQSPVAMSMTLREWLDGAALRADWRSAAAHRRGILRPWAETADVVERVLQRTMTSLEVSV